MKIIKDTLHKININGFDQYYTVKTDDTTKPVLLFLHGGPGGSNIGMASVLDSKTKLTEHFTLIQYDQRGAGKSYSKEMTKDNISLEMILNDTIKLIDKLLEVFHQEKLFIIGHSFGTLLGLRLCKEIPEKIIACISISQMVNVYESEKQLTRESIKLAEELKNQKYKEMIVRSKHFFNLGDYAQYIMLQRSALIKIGGLTHNRKPMNEILLYLISGLSKHYSLRDLFRMKKGLVFSTAILWNDVMKINLLEEIPQIEVPIYFISGKSDIVTSALFVQQYFDVIKAPDKEFISFAHSGHNPHIEEKELYEQTVIDLFITSNKERNAQ